MDPLLPTLCTTPPLRRSRARTRPTHWGTSSASPSHMSIGTCSSGVSMGSYGVPWVVSLMLPSFGPLVVARAGNGSKMGGLCRGYGGQRRRGMHDFLILSLPYFVVLVVSSIPSPPSASSLFPRGAQVSRHHHQPRGCQPSFSRPMVS